MNFIRDNIIKILFFIIAIVVVVVVVVACNGRTRSADSDIGYIEMENKLQSAAIRYVRKNKTLLPKTIDAVRKIQIDTLISENYINEMHAIDDKNVTCSGFVEIIKKDEENEEYRYTPHIKCGKYYETKTIADYIKTNEPIVTSGQGLYKSDDLYYFKGEYPNNYIMLGDNLYRIIEITKDNNLKLISTRRTENTYVWDDRYNADRDDYDGINDFEKSRLKENLEYIYNSEGDDYEPQYFSDIEKSYIVEHEFCTGKRSTSDKNIYSDTECKEKSTLKVGLMSIGDYYRSSIASNCNAVGQKACNNYNYIFSISKNVYYFTTLTANSDNTYTYYEINSGSLNTKRTSRDSRLLPVIYIDSNIIYKKGVGSSEDPYIVR